MSLLAGFTGLAAGLTVALVVRVRWVEERRHWQRVRDQQARHARQARHAYASEVMRLRRFIATLTPDEIPEVKR